MSKLSGEDIGILSVLANGIIPSDEHDEGALEVSAADIIAGRFEHGTNAKVYHEGIQLARKLALQEYSSAVYELNTDQVYNLLISIRSINQGFFKVLRGDVSAIYLSNTKVLKKIGFPGSSASLGGYADFDQPQ